jgi:hypothetical protein
MEIPRRGAMLNFWLSARSVSRFGSGVRVPIWWPRLLWGLGLYRVYGVPAIRLGSTVSLNSILYSLILPLRAKKAMINAQTYDLLPLPAGQK